MKHDVAEDNMTVRERGFHKCFAESMRGQQKQSVTEGEMDRRTKWSLFDVLLTAKLQKHKT